MRDVKNGSGEGQSIQQVDVSARKHMKTEDPLFGWTATDRPLEIPPDNLDPAPSTGTSINIFVRGVGVGLTHTENLMINKLRKVSETSGLELDGEFYFKFYISLLHEKKKISIFIQLVL